MQAREQDRERDCGRKCLSRPQWNADIHELVELMLLSLFVLQPGSWGAWKQVEGGWGGGCLVQRSDWQVDLEEIAPSWLEAG